MKQYSGFESKMMSDFEHLPAGGYVCKIMAAEVVPNRNGGGERMVLYIDIEDGDYKGFYAKQYKEDTREDKKWRGNYNIFFPRDDGSKQDGWAKNKFNNLIGCIEDANDGFHWDWDEKKLKGKKIALVFRREEYARQDGTTGWSVKPFKVISIGNCKDGKWGKYEDKPLPADKRPSGYSGGFETVENITDNDLPFDI